MSFTAIHCLSSTWPNCLAEAFGDCSRSCPPFPLTQRRPMSSEKETSIAYAGICDRAERDGGRACASARGDDAGEQPGHAWSAAVTGWRSAAQAVHGAALLRPQDRSPL